MDAIGNKPTTLRLDFNHFEKLDKARQKCAHPNTVSQKQRERDTERNVMSRPRPLTAGRQSAKRALKERVRKMYLQRRAVTSLSARSSGSARDSHRTHSGRKSVLNAFTDGESRDGQRRFASMELTPLAKFRLVARVAVVLIRLMKAIIANSNNMTLRSAAEMQWLTVYGRETQATMAFNKNLYSRDRVITHIPDWALHIHQLIPETRTEQHCRRLHALLRGLKSFDKFTDDIQMSLCRAFRLEVVSEGRIVLKHGHIGVYFYFIYSGSVFVNVEDETADGRTFMRTIATLTRGQSFGELALLQDIKRTATVSVREKCELLVVDKEVFARVCPKIFETELEEKRSFLRSMSLFPPKWWGSDAIRALSMEAQTQEFKINKVIVADSSLEDWIYTVIEGKCQVIHCLSLQSSGNDVTDQRKGSGIVLSEEIIDLLSSASNPGNKTDEKEVDEDMKEKLLSSMGLDYVTKGRGRHAFLKDEIEKERLRAIRGLDDATTLTALMKRREETRKGLVYLNVGVIESGQVFDLHSLVKNKKDTQNQSSSLMLVSGGAKILKVRKAAFFAQASDQALEHTRTLASKQRFLSDESLLESYKEKKKWERYKSQVVDSVVCARRHSHRPELSAHRPQSSMPKSLRSRSAGSSREISLPDSHTPEADNNEIQAVSSANQKENQAPPKKKFPSITISRVDYQNVLEHLQNKPRTDDNDSDGDTTPKPPPPPSFQTDAVIIRRKPMGTLLPQGRISRNLPARPHTVHPRFSTR